MVTETQIHDEAPARQQDRPAFVQGREPSRDRLVIPNGQRTRQRPLAAAFARGLSRIVTGFAALLALPLVVLMRILRPLILIRVGPLPSQRVGRFAFDVETYLCERELGLHG